MFNKVNKIELHFNFHNRFLRGAGADPSHKKYYCIDYLKMTEQESNDVKELYAAFFIIDEKEISDSGINMFSGYASEPLLSPTFSKCFTEEIKNELEDIFLCLDFSLLDTFLNTSKVSGVVSITKDEHFFIMDCEFVSLAPYPLKRTDIKFLFNNKTGLINAINKLSIVTSNLTVNKDGSR